MNIANTEQLFDEFKKQNAERPISIMIGTPMYGGQCYGEYALSLVRATSLMRSLGFKVRIEAMFNESLIPRARNRIAYAFHEETDYDFLMFIDADVGFGEMDIIKLLLADRELSAGVYPRKNINWPLIQKAAFAGKDNLADYSGQFVFNAIGMTDRETDDDGMVEVSHAATGFMLINRSVFDKLKPHVLQYTDRVSDSLYTCSEFFKCDINDVGRFTSEDYYFCDLWRKHGGKVFINPFIQLSHTGMHRFVGNLARMGTEAI